MIQFLICEYSTTRSGLNADLTISLAGFCFRLLSTAWSAYEIWRTTDIRTRFDTMITNGPCQVDLFPGYFRERLSIQIADVVLNFVALTLSAYLVRNLALVSSRPKLLVLS